MTQRARRAVLATLGVAAATVLCACGTFSTQGVVTGVAAVCAGGIGPPIRTVTVVAAVGSTPIASSTILSGGHYTFHLSAGHYLLTTGILSRRILLHAGATQRVSLVQTCLRPPA